MLSPYLRPGQEPTVRVLLEIPAAHVAGALQRLPETVQAMVVETFKMQPMAEPQPVTFGPEFEEQMAKMAELPQFREATELQRRQVEATEKLAGVKGDAHTTLGAKKIDLGRGA